MPRAVLFFFPPSDIQVAGTGFAQVLSRCRIKLLDLKLEETSSPSKGTIAIITFVGDLGALSDK